MLAWGPHKTIPVELLGKKKKKWHCQLMLVCIICISVSIICFNFISIYGTTFIHKWLLSYQAKHWALNLLIVWSSGYQWLVRRYMLGSIPYVSPRNRRFTWDAVLMCESMHSRSSLLCPLWVMGYMRVARVGCWQEQWRGTRKFRSIPIFSSPPFLLFLPGKGKDIKMILWKLLVLKMEVGTENNDRKKRAGTLRFGQNFCVDRYCLLPNF